MKRKKEEEPWEKIWKTGLGTSMIHISTLPCCLGQTYHFLYLPSHFLFVVKCWHSSLFNFLAIFKYHFKTASPYWTSILSFCPKFSNASLHVKIDNGIDLQTQQSQTEFLFHQIPDLFCIPITWHHLHPPNHLDWNYKNYFRLCFLSTHQHITPGQMLLQNLS